MTSERRVYTGFQQSRFDWSLECGIIAERDIYPSLMNATKVERFTGQKSFVDKEFGIDVLVTTGKGRQCAIAERFRGARYKRYQDLTIREESLYNIGKALEVHKSIARYMLYGYADVDQKDTQPPKCITQWLLVDLQPTIDKYMAAKIPFGKKQNHDGSSCFIHITFDTLRSFSLVVAES